MACTEVIEGRYVDLRSATIEDAEFTLAIRQAPEFSKWLPRIDNTIDQQKPPAQVTLLVRDRWGIGS